MVWMIGSRSIHYTILVLCVELLALAAGLSWFGYLSPHHSSIHVLRQRKGEGEGRGYSCCGQTDSGTRSDCDSWTRWVGRRWQTFCVMVSSYDSA